MELGATLCDLSLSDCPALTDAALVAVSAMCPRLRVLEIDRLEGVTDEGVRSVAEGCRELETFSAKRCEKLEARSACAAPPLHSSALRCAAVGEEWEGRSSPDPADGDDPGGARRRGVDC